MSEPIDGDRRPRVALIDDDLSVRRAFSRLLRPSGFDVDLYSSAYAFLSRPSGHWPDCALVDVRMPGQNGMALTEMLKAIAARVPVILMTGDADMHLAERATQCGAFALLSKPIEATVLIAAINNVLAAASSHKKGLRGDEIMRGAHEP